VDDGTRTHSTTLFLGGAIVGRTAPPTTPNLWCYDGVRRTPRRSVPARFTADGHCAPTSRPCDVIASSKNGGRRPVGDTSAAGCHGSCCRRRWCRPPREIDCSGRPGTDSAARGAARSRRSPSSPTSPVRPSRAKREGIVVSCRRPPSASPWCSARLTPSLAEELVNKRHGLRVRVGVVELQKGQFARTASPSSDGFGDPWAAATFGTSTNTNTVAWTRKSYANVPMSRGHPSPTRNETVNLSRSRALRSPIARQ